MGLLLFLLLLLLQLSELHSDFGAVRADFSMVAKLATLSKVCLAQVALEGFLASVRILVLLFVLLQAERLRAEAALKVLLRVVLLVVALQTELGLEGSVAAKNVALKNGRGFLAICAIFLCLQRTA